MKEIKLLFLQCANCTRQEKDYIKKVHNIPFLDKPDGTQIGVCYVDDNDHVIAVTEDNKEFEILTRKKKKWNELVGYKDY